MNASIDELEEPEMVKIDPFMSDTAILRKRMVDPILDQTMQSSVKGKKKKKRMASFGGLTGKLFKDHIKRKSLLSP